MVNPSFFFTMPDRGGEAPDAVVVASLLASSIACMEAPFLLRNNFSSIWCFEGFWAGFDWTWAYLRGQDFENFDASH